MFLPPQMNTDTQTNKSSRSNHSQQWPNTETGQETQISAQQKRVLVGVERTVKGETGVRSKEQKSPVETGDNKAFVTLVENLKGDPGVNSNSSDGKQRKGTSLKESALKKSQENKLRGKAGEF